MTEEIKVQQTAEEATSAVPAGHQASTVGTRHGAERNDRKPTDAWTALLELETRKNRVLTANWRAGKLGSSWPRSITPPKSSNSTSYCEGLIHPSGEGF